MVCDKNGYGIVTELAESGSLYDYLRKQNKASETLDYDRVILWALDIARGMEYLHFQAPQTVIHRDLKSKNVVISSSLNCKLCDFGSSKFQQNSLREASTIAGTMAWMAPEVIKESLVIEASDTYSFAIVLWELLTCRVPYHNLENIQVAWLVAMKGERPHLPSEVPKKFKLLIQNCWKEDPKQRPNFQFLVKNLDNLRQDTDLQEKTDQFLDNPEKWLLDIKEKNDKLMMQSSELTDKEKQLQIWERQLNIKEKKLFQKEQRQHSNNTYQSLEKWSPIRVYEWVKGLRNGEGDDLENQYLDLASRFYAESVDGKALMLLGEEDLVKMKVNGLGVRLDLLDYIKELRVSNQNMMNFPPLAATLPKFTPQTVQNQTLKTVDIVLIFGSICRYNPDVPRENKWKLYLELDGDEGAIPTVQSVEFAMNDRDWKVSLTRPPFIMNSWLVAEKLGMTQCQVLFDDLIVVTPTEATHLFTPDRGDDTSEAKVQLRIKTTSKIGVTPHNSLPTSEYPAPPIMTSSSNQFDFTSGDLNRSGSINVAEYKGPELFGAWANSSSSLAHKLDNQNCPKRIVKGGPMPTSYSSSSLHPNSSLRSQSSMSHVSPRLSHASSSRASSPSNSINLVFNSPNRSSSRTPVQPGIPRSSTHSFTPTPISHIPRDKRHSLPAKHYHTPSPVVKNSFRYTQSPTSIDSIEERGYLNGEGTNDFSDERYSSQDVRERCEASEDSYRRYSSDACSVDSKRDEHVRSRPSSQQQRDGKLERKDNYTKRNQNRDYRRDETRDRRREDTREYRRDYTRDHRRDDTKDNRRDRGRDDTRDHRKDDTLRRRDNTREQRGVGRNSGYRREERTNYRRDRDREPRRFEGREERDLQYRRGSIPLHNSISNSHEVNNKPAETGNDSDSEWTVVVKNKSKSRK